MLHWCNEKELKVQDINCKCLYSNVWVLETKKQTKTSVLCVKQVCAITSKRRHPERKRNNEKERKAKSEKKANEFVEYRFKQIK